MNWTFDQPKVEPADDYGLGDLFERARYRWHVTRRDKVSPYSKRWMRRWKGRNRVTIREMVL